MLRGITVAKKLMKVLLHSKAIRGLAMCAALWLMSGSVLALVHQNPVPSRGAYVQVGGTVNVVVSSTGCSPSSSTQAAGQITLHVTNQTGAELAVQLYGSHGELIREVNISQGATQWSETFDLAAGNYTLIADHNPEWIFHLTVQ